MSQTPDSGHGPNLLLSLAAAPTPISHPCLARKIASSLCRSACSRTLVFIPVDPARPHTHPGLSGPRRAALCLRVETCEVRLDSSTVFPGYKPREAVFISLKLCIPLFVIIFLSIVAPFFITTFSNQLVFYLLFLNSVS